MKNVLLSISVGVLVVLVGLLAYLGVSTLRKALETPVPPAKLSAVSGTTFTEPCLEIGGGAQLCTYRQSFATATTTLCSISPPRSSTSTIVYLAITSVGTSATAALATTTSESGAVLTAGIDDASIGVTTTPLIDKFHLQGGKLISRGFTLVASSSLAGTSTPSISLPEYKADVFAPTARLNVVVKNSAAGDYRQFAPVGWCTAQFLTTTP